MNKNEIVPKIDEKKERTKELIESSRLDYEFYLMLVLSTVIVSLGLLLNNIPIIIGGMLITPLLSPLLTTALGIVVADKKVLWWSVKIILKSIGVILLVSLIMTIITPDKALTEEISSRTFINLSFFYVAIASGIAAAFAWARKELSVILPGVAIAVAILPPFATIAIGIGMWDVSIVIGALQSSVANLIGIVISAVVVFALLGFYRVRTVAMQKVAVEERKEENKNK
jgi:uncharacterized hydrophobic protein (TIGR00271 family)